MIVLTDIEADSNNTQSMVLFLACANEFEVEGLIDMTSTHQRQWHKGRYTFFLELISNGLNDPEHPE